MSSLTICSTPSGRILCKKIKTLSNKLSRAQYSYPAHPTEKQLNMLARQLTAGPLVTKWNLALFRTP